MSMWTACVTHTVFLQTLTQLIHCGQARLHFEKNTVILAATLFCTWRCRKTLYSPDFGQMTFGVLYS